MSFFTKRLNKIKTDNSEKIESLLQEEKKLEFKNIDIPKISLKDKEKENSSKKLALLKFNPKKEPIKVIKNYEKEFEDLGIDNTEDFELFREASRYRVNTNRIENNTDIVSKTIKDIESIEFTLLSNEEILKNSVSEINNTKWEGDGSLYDLRMGAMDDNKKCVSCNLEWKWCSGHFGHIKLAYPIPHPIQMKLILKYLQVFCRNCYKLIIKKENMYILDILKYKKDDRLERIFKESEKIAVCPHCSHAVLRYYNVEDRYFMKSNNKNEKYVVQYSEVCKILKNIPPSEHKLCGYTDERTHPRNLVIENLVVLPPCARPYVTFGDNQHHDDLTYKYIDIIKINKKIEEIKIDKTRNDLVYILYFHIKTLMDNNKNQAKESSGKRPIKCIKKRLTGKTGQIRNNIQGKRCDFNARTVITPEAYCKADELIIPPAMAKKLTYPVKVFKDNIEECKKILKEGKVNTIIRDDKKYETKFACNTRGFEIDQDDIIYRGSSKFTVWLYEHDKGKKFQLQPGDVVQRGDELFRDLQISQPKTFDLKEGDILERQLKNGDVVVLNRQPTLWRGSMRAKKVIIRPGKTLRFQLSSTAPFNADFDGDN